MLITCPKCRTNYNVPSIADNPEQKVRCVKCGHVWKPAMDMVDPVFLNFSLIDKEVEEEQKALSASAPAFQEFFKEETEIKKDNLSKWIYPLFFLSLFCIAASIYLFFFHIPERSAVTLQTISYEMAQQDYKKYLILQAAAFNNTDEDIRPEEFTVYFIDENDNTLTTAVLPSPIDVLPARGINQLKFQIERPPSKTVQAVLKLTKMQTQSP